MSKAEILHRVESLVDEIVDCGKSIENCEHNVVVAAIFGDETLEDSNRLEAFRLGLVEKRCRERLDQLGAD